jgi:hypothetical protein
MQKDKTYFEGYEPAVEVKACLMHPHFESIENYTVESPISAFNGVNYGLCTACHIALGANPNYQNEINEEIVKRLKELKQNKEN